jgi:hypothetical protein
MAGSIELRPTSLIISREPRSSETEKIELFGQLLTASIHAVVSLSVENVVVTLFEINEHRTNILINLQLRPHFVEVEYPEQV